VVDDLRRTPAPRAYWPEKAADAATSRLVSLCLETTPAGLRSISSARQAESPLSGRADELIE